MEQELVIFEDDKFSNFHPLTLSRPIYELRCGAQTLREKIARNFPEYNVSLFCRDYLAPLVSIETGLSANSLSGKTARKTIFINGRLRLGEKLTEALLSSTTNQVYRQGETVAAAVINGPLATLDPKSINLPINGLI